MTWLKRIGDALAGGERYELPELVPTDIKQLDSWWYRCQAKIVLSLFRRKLYIRLGHPMKGGLRTDQTLIKLYQRMAYRNPKGSLAIVLRTVLYRVQRGARVSDAIGEFCPLNEYLLIKSGEEKGKLYEGLLNAAHTIQARKQMFAVVIRAAISPIAVAAIVVASLYVVGAKMVPELEVSMPREEWKGLGYMIGLLGDFAANNGFLYFVYAILTLSLVVVLSFKRWAGFGRTIADKLPPYSLYKVFEGAAWMIVLSSMVRSGVHVSVALENIKNVAAKKGNKYIEKRTVAVMEHNSSGKANVAVSMERSKTNFPDREVIEDLVMMASAGDFDDIMYEHSWQWFDTKVEDLKTKCLIMELVLLILSLLVIGFVFFSVYDLQQQFMDTTRY